MKKQIILLSLTGFMFNISAMKRSSDEDREGKRNVIECLSELPFVAVGGIFPKETIEMSFEEKWSHDFRVPISQSLAPLVCGYRHRNIAWDSTKQALCFTDENLRKSLVVDIVWKPKSVSLTEDSAYGFVHVEEDERGKIPGHYVLRYDFSCLAQKTEESRMSGLQKFRVVERDENCYVNVTCKYKYLCVSAYHINGSLKFKFYDVATGACKRVVCASVATLMAFHDLHFVDDQARLRCYEGSMGRDFLVNLAEILTALKAADGAPK